MMPVHFLKRFNGIQSNASILTPEELNNCNILHQDNFDENISSMCVLHNEYNFKILGGCCGTNEIFIEELTKKLLKYESEKQTQTAC